MSSNSYQRAWPIVIIVLGFIVLASVALIVVVSLAMRLFI